MTIVNTVVENPNTAQDGGGIYNTGTLDVTASTIGSNTATASGGGIYTLDGTTVVTASTISGNQATFLGGGAYSQGAQHCRIHQLDRQR